MNPARNGAAGGFCIAADRLKHHPDLAVTGVSSEALFRGEAKSFFVGSMAVEAQRSDLHLGNGSPWQSSRNAHSHGQGGLVEERRSTRITRLHRRTGLIVHLDTAWKRWKVYSPDRGFDGFPLWGG